MILLCPKVEESAPKIVADRLSALRESVGITRHESRQNIRVGASLRSQGHSVFVEVLHDRFSEAIKGCVRGGTLLAGHPPRAPQTLTNGGT